MAFTYDFTTQPVLSMVRLLVGDTVDAGHIWEDAEINAVLQMESSQGLYIGLTGYTVVPPQVYSPRRAAAALVDGLASSRGRLAGSLKVLDIQLDLGSAAKSLRDTAQSLRDTEADSGAFAIAEMVENSFTMRERFWNQIARQAA